VLWSVAPANVCDPGLTYAVRTQALDVCAPASGRDPAQQSYVIAKGALSRARALESVGNFDAALLHLRVVEATVPRISDHVAVMRAELHTQAGDPVQAAKAYDEAIRAGMNTDLVAHAHVGYVRSLLEAGNPKADKELEQLLRRYPECPEGASLKLLQAQHREAAGSTRTALATYRALDLTMPGYPIAAEARERIEVMRARGVVIPPYTPAQLLERTERLVKSGPVSLARKQLEELEASPQGRTFKAQIEAMRVRLSHVDASYVPPEANATTILTPEEQHKRTIALLGNKKVSKLRPFQLTAMLERASRENLTEAADLLTLELARRVRTVPPAVRFDGLVIASGTASDASLVTLADTLIDQPKLAAAAHYHRARAIERLGRVEEAKAELAQVISLDASATRFYANWADQRLRWLRGERPSGEGPLVAPGANDTQLQAHLRALESKFTVDASAAISVLEDVAGSYGEAFPWIERALDLARLDETRAAADELYEAFLAYQSLRGRRGVRAGLEAVYRGTSVVRRPSDAQTRRARLSLSMTTRNMLARAASALGDDGTAAMFGGSSWSESRPQPYPREVALAASKHRIDPDLLFAVMRVESVYQRRIISHAGAIGLMQIMPRTGRLIANELGQTERTSSDLLDPETNLNFAAWYLSSLLQRMNGHLPLAIASYNGGPHNVRKWIHNFGEHVPLDAFLERIPFTETRRYVRRVLGYYARYKSSHGEKIALMDVALPSAVPTQITF
jgi:soluble lytic murein transglycosylase